MLRRLRVRAVRPASRPRNQPTRATLPLTLERRPKPMDRRASLGQRNVHRRRQTFCAAADPYQRGVQEPGRRGHRLDLAARLHPREHPKRQDQLLRGIGTHAAWRRAPFGRRRRSAANRGRRDPADHPTAPPQQAPASPITAPRSPARRLHDPPPSALACLISDMTSLWSINETEGAPVGVSITGPDNRRSVPDGIWPRDPGVAFVACPASSFEVGDGRADCPVVRRNPWLA